MGVGVGGGGPKERRRLWEPSARFPATRNEALAGLTFSAGTTAPPSSCAYDLEIITLRKFPSKESSSSFSWPRQRAIRKEDLERTPMEPDSG